MAKKVAVVITLQRSLTSALKIEIRARGFEESQKCHLHEYITYQWCDCRQIVFIFPESLVNGGAGGTLSYSSGKQSISNELGGTSEIWEGISK
jgi:hypothetical protein